MIILHNNNQIVGFLMDREKSPSSDYASYIEVDEVQGNKVVIRGIIQSQSDWSRYSVQDGRLYLDGVEINLVSDDDKRQLRSEYLSTVSQLQTIENATSPTNAQVIVAVKFIAKTLRLLLRVLVRLL